VSETDRIAEFKEVAELMPEDPVVRFGLAGAYLEAGQAPEAAVEYEAAIRRHAIANVESIVTASRSGLTACAHADSTSFSRAPSPYFFSASIEAVVTSASGGVA